MPFPTELELFPVGDLAPATAKTKFQQWLAATIALLGQAGTPTSARAGLGSTTVGDAVFTSANAAAARAAIGISLPRGYIGGLTIANNASDPNNDIDVSVGEAVDSTSVVLMQLTSLMTKRIDAAWAAGTGNGGLDTGAVGNNIYSIYLIRKDSDGSIDVLFSLSPTTPTMPSGYTQKRRIGYAIRVAGALRQFTMNGDRVDFKTLTLDYSTTTLGTSVVTVNLNATQNCIPANTYAILNVYLERSAATASVYIYPTSASDQAPSDTLAPLSTFELGVSGSPVVLGTQQIDVAADASSQIKVVASSISTTLRLSTRGYIDTRGRFA